MWDGKVFDSSTADSLNAATARSQKYADDVRVVQSDRAERSVASPRRTFHARPCRLTTGFPRTYQKANDRRRMADGERRRTQCVFSGFPIRLIARASVCSHGPTAASAARLINFFAPFSQSISRPGRIDHSLLRSRNGLFFEFNGGNKKKK